MKIEDLYQLLFITATLIVLASFFLALISSIIVYRKTFPKLPKIRRRKGGKFAKLFYPRIWKTIVFSLLVLGACFILQMRFDIFKINYKISDLTAAGWGVYDSFSQYIAAIFGSAGPTLFRDYVLYAVLIIVLIIAVIVGRGNLDSFASWLIYLLVAFLIGNVIYWVIVGLIYLVVLFFFIAIPVLISGGLGVAMHFLFRLITRRSRRGY